MGLKKRWVFTGYASHSKEELLNYIDHAQFVFLTYLRPPIDLGRFEIQT